MYICIYYIVKYIYKLKYVYVGDSMIKKYTITLEEDIKNKVIAIAEKEGATFSGLIRALFKKYIEERQ